MIAVWKVEGHRKLTCCQERLAGRPRDTSRSVFVARFPRLAGARRGFTLFVFISMLAYSAQELLFEPFAGLVFGYSLGQSARLSGLWHAAVLVGMIIVGVACSGQRHDSLLRACMGRLLPHRPSRS